MRIPSGVTDQYIYFVAVDSTDFTSRETGLSSFTVYRSRDGAAAAAMTTPTINETDATNMPGVYELLLDEDMSIAAGNDSEEMAFHITHAGMAPVTRTIELYRPKITAGETATVSSGIASVNLTQISGSAVNDTVSQLGVNVVNIGAETVGLSTNNRLQVDVAEWNDVELGTTNPLPNAAADAAGGLIISDAGGLDADNRMLSAAAVTNGNTVYDTDFASNYDTTNDRWVAAMDTAPSYRGNFDANAGNPDTSLILATGDFLMVTVAGTWDSNVLAIGDFIIAKSASPSASDSTDWAVVTAQTYPTNFEDLSIENTTGIVSADVLKINSSTPAATKLAASALGLIAGTAQTGTLSTTVMTTDLTGYADDELIGATVVWTTGTAAGQRSAITDYASTNGTITYNAIATAPANADDFVVV